MVVQGLARVHVTKQVSRATQGSSPRLAERRQVCATHTCAPRLGQTQGSPYSRADVMLAPDAEVIRASAEL
jgi:hypothetical protein